MGDDALTAWWPTFGLRLHTPRLTLTPVRDDDLAELVTLVRAGIHDPDDMPFSIPWTLASVDDLPGNFLRYQWSLRARTGPDEWTLPFVVWEEGRIVGLQDVGAREFAVRRVVDTGSWLGRAHQGRGIGTEMRAAVLAFAFDHLGADVALSAAFVDNLRSRGVSDRLGYQVNGQDVVQRRPGERAVSVRLRVTPEIFLRPAWTLRVEGVDACRTLLGLGDRPARMDSADAGEGGRR